MIARPSTPGECGLISTSPSSISRSFPKWFSWFPFCHYWTKLGPRNSCSSFFPQWTCLAVLWKSRGMTWRPWAKTLSPNWLRPDLMGPILPTQLWSRSLVFQSGVIPSSAEPFPGRRCSECSAAFGSWQDRCFCTKWPRIRKSLHIFGTPATQEGAWRSWVDYFSSFTGRFVRRCLPWLPVRGPPYPPIADWPPTDSP